MHIAVLSDWEASGGANIAALRLTEGLAAAGHQITRIYQKARTEDVRWSTRLIPSLWSSHEFSLPRKVAWRVMPDSLKSTLHQRHSQRTLAAILNEIQPDVVHLHNLHIGGWSPEMIRVCTAQAPTVCTLHDTWTLTGRCYNPGDCEKYLTGCDHLCPTAHEYPALKPHQIRPAWDLRLQIFRQSKNLAAVTPSSWLGHLAAAQMWKARPVFRIPYGLDLQIYMPMNRETAQRALGLRPEDPVILCCAAELSNRKKGLHLVVDALAAGLGRIQLLLLGALTVLPTLPNAEVHNLGYIESDRMKALVYSSADLYVHPSLADNAPNTVIEALACGTPAVALPIDGLPEMVIPGKTGWLASGVSSDALRTALKSALADLDAGANLRGSCRRFAEQQYNMPKVIQAYERVFEFMRTGQKDGVTELFLGAPGRPMQIESIEPSLAPVEP
jgi:glycosyltransferase involved in cell wall biosynthesis